MYINFPKQLQFLEIICARMGDKDNDVNKFDTCTCFPMFLQIALIC